MVLCVATLLAIQGLYHLGQVSGFSPFLSSRLRVGPTHSHELCRDMTLLSFAATKVREEEDLLLQDDDEEKAQRILVRGIERDWSIDGVPAGGDMQVDLFIPEHTEPKGAVFFMHGFSQYPVAYRKTLKRLTSDADVAVVAVRTGLLSKVAWDISNLELSLQRAVSRDTEQCIQMVIQGKEPFAEYIGREVPIGLCGHSMGGGLCFPLATKFENINYVFAMAPFPGVEQFDPFEAIEQRPPDHSMLLAGSWDLIARSETVMEISAASNDSKAKSSLYVEIDRGLHTGFEDVVVLFVVPLKAFVRFILDFPAAVELIFLNLFQLFRTSTGQLDVSRELMTDFFKRMVNEEDVTLEGAKETLDEMEKWQDKATVDYGK